MVVLYLEQIFSASVKIYQEWISITMQKLKKINQHLPLILEFLLRNINISI